MASRFLTPFSTRGPRAADPLLDLHREVNRLFEDVFNVAPAGPQSAAPTAIAARLDVHETEQEICISAELPGVKRSDVDVRLDGDVITISGEKKNAHEQQQRNVHLSERSYGRFQRTLQLPFTPDPSQVRAEFDSGVLTVRLQKQPEAQRSHRIEVREGSQTIEASSSPTATVSQDATREVEPGMGRSDLPGAEAGVRH